MFVGSKQLCFTNASHTDVYNINFFHDPDFRNTFQIKN